MKDKKSALCSFILDPLPQPHPTLSKTKLKALNLIKEPPLPPSNPQTNKQTKEPELQN